MASDGKQFPPQRQEKQPGLEHLMDPTPQATSHEYRPSNKLKGKVALVTGGDSGIGRAVCHCFAMEGASVAFTYVKPQEDKDAEDTMRLLKKSKSHDAEVPIYIAADVGYDENCKRVVDEVVKAYGCIDILVNNAAVQYKSDSVEDISPQQLENVFRTNIFSYFYFVRHALKYTKEGSVIINTTSVNAYKGHPTLLDYTATKGAIVAFTRGLALQLVKRGIRVNGVAPGPCGRHLYRLLSVRMMWPGLDPRCPWEGQDSQLRLHLAMSSLPPLIHPTSLDRSSTPMVE